MSHPPGPGPLDSPHKKAIAEVEAAAPTDVKEDQSSQLHVTSNASQNPPVGKENRWVSEHDGSQGKYAIWCLPLNLSFQVEKLAYFSFVQKKFRRVAAVRQLFASGRRGSTTTDRAISTTNLQ